MVLSESLGPHTVSIGDRISDYMAVVIRRGLHSKGMKVTQVSSASALTWLVGWVVPFATRANQIPGFPALRPVPGLVVISVKIGRFIHVLN